MMSSATLNSDLQPGLRQWPAMVKRHPRPANSDLLTGFGPRLVAAREALGKRQVDLARELGVSAQRLANWEADLHPPEPYVLVQLKHLGISVDYLLTGDMGNLTAKLLQGLVARGTARGLDPVAREVRDVVKELPEPTVNPPRGRLHQRQAPAPRRFIHPPDIQQE